MKDIFITRYGQDRENGIIHSDGDETYLLHREPDLEAIIERMSRGTVGFLYTVHKDTSFDFTYLLKGVIELWDEEERVLLHPGDTYAHRALGHQIMFRAVEDIEYLAIHTNPCYEEYEEEHRFLNDTLDNLQKVDGDTLNHCVRVKTLSLGICFYLDKPLPDLWDLFYAASFHDVGKARVPVEVLLKPGRLTREEFEIMKQHSRYTHEMIRDNCGEDIASIAFEHHEKLDGTGYPRGLKGDEISIGARVICVADAYDAMTVTRPYHEGMSREAALAELRRCSGTQFDPRVIRALEQYLTENT